jgi:hypothetical protein
MTGILTSIGSTGFRGVEALAFHPLDGRLWGWAERSGLVEIDIATGNARLILRSRRNIEGLAWNNEGTLLYAASGKWLWVYDPHKDSFTRIAKNLPGRTESLAMSSDGLLLGGTQFGKKWNIFVYDLEKLKPVAGEGFMTPYKDIEGLAIQKTCDSPPPPVPDICSYLQVTNPRFKGDNFLIDLVNTSSSAIFTLDRVVLQWPSVAEEADWMKLDWQTIWNGRDSDPPTDTLIEPRWYGRSNTVLDPGERRAFNVDFDRPGPLSRIAELSDFQGTRFYFREGCSIELIVP